MGRCLMSRTKPVWPGRQAGFTLIEIMIVGGVLAFVLAIFVLGVRQASGSFALRQAASITLSELRKAQASAMAEGSGVSYTVEFVSGTTGGLNVYRQTSRVKTITPPDWPASVTFDNTQTTFPTCPVGIGNPSNACVTFQPLGYASAGGSAALRGGVGTQTTWLVSVIAATGKVSVTQQ